jgi:hypothetical protein
MQWSIRAFFVVDRLLNGSGVSAAARARLPSTGHRHVHSPEEIALLIAESGMVACSSHRSRCGCIAPFVSVYAVPGS